MQLRPPRLDIRHWGILISLPIALTAGDRAMSDSGSDRRTAPGTGAPSTRVTSVGTPSPALFQAAGDIVVRVETSGIFALQGETVSLSIGLALVNASAPAAAYSVAVNWSPAELAFVNVTAGNFSTGLGSFTPDLTDTFTGYVEVTANEPTGVNDGAFTLYNVNLTVDEAVARGSVLDIFVNVFQLDGPAGENLLPEMRLGTGVGQICLANYVFGDVTQNGAVTAGDVVQILRSLVGLPLSAGVDLGLADVTGDGLATTSDAVEILRGIVGLAVPAGSQFGKAAVSGCPTPSPSAATSLITATPTTIVADGISTSEITVTLLDDFGNDLVFGGDAVALSTTAGTLSPVTDNGTGIYTATLTAGTTVGTAILTGTVNGPTITASGTVDITAIRVAGLGTTFGNQATADIFSFGDLGGSFTVLTDATFNAMTPADLRASYEVLIFRCCVASATINADWTTRLVSYMALGGGIIWEDGGENLSDLVPGVTASPGFLGGITLSATVPGLTDGIISSFVNSHITFSAWDPALSPFIVSGATTVGLYGQFGTGCIVLTGPDNDWHAVRGGIDPEGNQYNLLLNEVRFVAKGCS